MPADKSSVEPHVSLIGTNVQNVAMPRISLGTWPAQGQEAVSMVRGAIERGYRHLDTAQRYDNEDAVGEAIQTSGVARGDLFVTTKILREDHGNLSLVRAAIERSLSTMGLDYADLVLIHWPNADYGKYVETAGSLAELTKSGLIRAWGVSNFKAHHVAELSRSGLTAAVNQIQLDPIVAQQDNEAANKEAGTLTSAYSPLGRGVDYTQYPVLVEAAERTGKTQQQVVLRWHLEHGRAIAPRSTNPGRQAQNLDLFDFTLTEEEIAGIDALDSGAQPFLDADEFGH